ncbi:MAG: chromosome segregation protein SMC [Chloroflexota bacterium]
MRLKTIELQGYKTFAGKTSFKMAEQVTCIVGPNGSGKSNIADAIRWVLGEQSYSLLRGKKTVDMIFHGSNQRSQAGMASVEIIFDNANGWLPVDFTEVSIGRRAYRDGSNEYRLNGQKVRLKDIAELLGNSGLSERTYTIIGQGLVDSALSLRAEERRKLFEEAAGIGLYRSRRDEAQRRLDTTLRNLERVEDILAELKPRLRSLERQSRRAQEHEQVRDDLRMLLRDWYGFHWQRTQRELNEARSAAKSQESIWDQARQEQLILDEKLGEFRVHIQGVRARLGSWHRELSHLHAQRETMTRELAVSDERRRSLVMQQQNVSDESARFDEQMIAFSERLAETDTDVKRLRLELEEAQQQVKSAQETLAQRQTERENLETSHQQASTKLASFTQQQNRLQARLTERSARDTHQREELLNTEQAVKDAELTFKQVAQRLSAAAADTKKAAAAEIDAEQTLITHRQHFTAVESEKKDLLEVRSTNQADLARLEAQLEVLDQAEKALAGYASGTQLLLKSSQKGSLKGAKGALSSQLEVPKAFETAIAAALGEYLDAVLLHDETSSSQALDLLSKETTRGALLPLDALAPLPPLSVKPAQGVEGVAASLVQAPAALRPAVDLLLGQTLIVHDHATARRVLVGKPSTARAVTLRGEVFHASGPITAGLDAAVSTLSRPRQRKEMDAQIKNAQQLVADIQTRIKKLDKSLEKMAAETEKLKRDVEASHSAKIIAAQKQAEIDLTHKQTERQVQWQRSQHNKLSADIADGEIETKDIQNQLSELTIAISQSDQNLQKYQNALIGLSSESFQTQVSHWNTQAAVAERALGDAQTRHHERQTAFDQAKQDKLSLTRRLSALGIEADELDQKMTGLREQESKVTEQVKTLMALIDPAEDELESSENQQMDLQEDEAAARQSLSASDRRHAQAQLTLSRRQESLDRLRERVEADFGLVSFSYAEDVSGPTPLPLGDFVEQLPTVLELPKGMGETIKQQRAQLRRMGAVNPEAQQEYEEVNQRFTFMNTQVDDLKRAETDVKEVIAELDLLMEREFRKTFDAVAIEFREIFTRLFGGGSARLVLTDPENLTDTGIDIDARLPGRRTQNLSLLSGGERSLTATALVFSLLKVSPTPFCVLDEVDAMLDEANVGRFRDLLSELSKNTQFIVITHNRNTVQVADVIYGVTMGRDTASQVISLKLDQVAEVMES